MSAGTKLMKKERRLKPRFGAKDHFDLFTLAIPGLLFLIAFNYIPLWGVVLPFKEVNYAKSIFQWDWIGFENFEFFFKSGNAWRTIRNTVGLNLLSIAVNTSVGVVLAVLMFELSRKYIKIYQTMMFFPYFVSWIVASYVLHAIISPEMGFLPKLMESWGMEKINFYYEAKYWPFILTLARLWKGIGYQTLLYYASLMSIDPTYFEAAALDGASRFDRFRYIILPHLKHLIIMLTILSLGSIFCGDFSMYYTLTKDIGALYATTDVIDTFVYRALTELGDPGMSAAVGLFQSVVGCILVLLTNFITKKIDPEQAIF